MASLNAFFTVLLLFIMSVFGSKENNHRVKYNTGAREGERVQITCNVGEEGNSSGTWKVTYTLPMNAIDEEDLMTSPRYSLERIGIFWVLTIKKVNITDSGTYTCITNRGIIYEYRLEVVENLPYFLKPLANVTVEEGDYAKLDCLVENLQNYSISWIRQDTNYTISHGMNVFQNEWKYGVIFYSDTEVTLLLRNVTAADIGLYTCQINSDPIVSQTAYVHIKDLPWFAEPIKNVTVKEGHDASLTCVVKDLKHHKLAWLHEDSGTVLAINKHAVSRNHRISLSHDHHSYTINIERVRMHDSGAYMCQINTDPVMSQIGYLNVKKNELPWFPEPLQNVTAQKGDNVTLSCIVENFRHSKISWLHGSRIVSAHDKMFMLNKRFSVSVDHKHVKSLYIRNVKMRDQGIYECQINKEPPLVQKAYLTVINPNGDTDIEEDNSSDYDN